MEGFLCSLLFKTGLYRRKHKSIEWETFGSYFSCQSQHVCKIISPLVGSSPPDKYSYEIGRRFVDPLTVHSLDSSIDSSRTKEVVFAFMFQSEVIL